MANPFQIAGTIDSPKPAVPRALVVLSFVPLLLVPIGGREFAFHGSYSLVDGSLQLGTEIPLEILGSKVSTELDKARGVIDGKTLVPIEIRGTLSKPRSRPTTFQWTSRSRRS